MTQAYQLTQIADQDLSEIWRDTCKHWSAKQADKYLSELEACFIELTEFPKLGKQRPDINAAYRSLHRQHHIIFYRQQQGRIEIIRVLHERMDIKMLTQT